MIDETGTGTKVISHTSYSLSCLNIHMSNFKIINASKSLSWLCKKIPCTSVFFFYRFYEKSQTNSHSYTDFELFPVNVKFICDIF